MLLKGKQLLAGWQKPKQKHKHKQTKPNKPKSSLPALSLPSPRKEADVTGLSLPSSQLIEVPAWDWLVCHSPSSHLQLSQKKKKNQHKLQKCSRGVLPANTSFPRKSDSSKGSWFSPFVSRKKEKKKNQTCRKRHLSILSSFIIC